MTPEDFPKKIVDQFNDLLGQRLIDMPIGATLCVHDDTALYFPMNEDFGDGSVYKFTMKLETHVLLEGERCNSPVGRTQYGPKTQEIERIISQK